MELLASVFCEDILAEITMYAMSVDDAIAAGDLKALQLLAKYMGFKTMAEKCNGVMIDTAAHYGYLRIIKWLHAVHDEKCTTDAMNWAAESGHLDIVKWLHENRTELGGFERGSAPFGCTKDAMDWAATNGHLDIVKWLHANCRMECTAHAIEYAAANGHIDVVKWLLEKCTELVGFERKGLCPFRTPAQEEARGEAALCAARCGAPQLPFGCTECALAHAIERKHLFIAKLLSDARPNICARCAENAFCIDIAKHFSKLRARRKRWSWRLMAWFRTCILQLLTAMHI